MYFILFVLQNPERLEDLLTAWEKAGVTGITVLPSIGLAKIKEKQALQEDFPLIPNLEHIFETQENPTRSIFTLVASEETVNAVYDATISIVGDLLHPNSGIFIVLPVFKAFGLRNS
jgi:nitrogen regulatory protein P-II 1